MTRHNTDVTVLNCTTSTCRDQVDEQDFDEHMCTRHPQEWAKMMAEVHRRLDAMYPEGWVMPQELVDKGWGKSR